MAEGGKEAIRVDEEVVGSSEFKALEKRIRELERVLGKKTLENEILREAVKVAHEKKLISRLPSLPDEGSLCRRSPIRSASLALSFTRVFAKEVAREGDTRRRRMERSWRPSER